MYFIKKKQKPNYGYYYFKPYVLMLSFFIIIGAGMIFYSSKENRSLLFLFGIAVIAYGILTTLGWTLARYVIPGSRIKKARNSMKSLNLAGSELVLDVGSGKGIYAIEVAKLLTTGKVIGIDIWEPQNLSRITHHHKLSQPTGNTILNAQRNAKIEGVTEKIEFINMDANHLQFESDSFDLVICGFIIGHQGKHRLNALREIDRVLKPAGKLLLIDNFRDFTYFLLSTPHLFILSLIRGTKAKQLTKKNWIEMIKSGGFHIYRLETRRSIITVECRKEYFN